MEWIYATLMVFLTIQLSGVHSQDPCVAFGDIRRCSSHSTWAFGTPNLTVTSAFDTTLERTFSVLYSLQMDDGSTESLCSYSYIYPATTCSKLYAGTCISCMNSAVNGSVSTVFYIPEISMAKNGSKLLLTVTQASLFNYDLHTFSVTACPETVNEAESMSPDPCGYNCESQFNCTNGYVLNDEANPNATYQCSAAATWNLPSDLCVQEATPTVSTTIPVVAATSTKSIPQDTTTTETAVTTTKGGGSNLDAQRKKLEIALSVIGGLSILADFDYKELMPLAAALVCCMLAWGILIGVNAGVAEFAAFVSASVLGSFALLGMVIVIVLLILQLKGGGDKGIKGKKAAEKDVSLNKQ